MDMDWPIKDNLVETLISVNSAKSFVANYFSSEHKAVVSPHIKVTIEDLESMIEGYENVFKEDAKIKISLLVTEMQNFDFDETFGNIIFYAKVEFLFSNPKNEKFLSAKIDATIKGTINIKINNGQELSMIVKPENHVCTQFWPYFKTETTLSEVNKVFIKEYSDKILRETNKALDKSLFLPFGNNDATQKMASNITFKKDFVII